MTTLAITRSRFVEVVKYHIKMNNRRGKGAVAFTGRHLLCAYTANFCIGEVTAGQDCYK